MSYEQWNDYRLKSITTASATAAKTKKPRSKTTVRKLTYKEQREYDNMEQTILKAEAEVQRLGLEAETSDPACSSDHKRAAQTYHDLSAAQLHVKELYARWSQLDAIHSGS